MAIVPISGLGKGSQDFFIAFSPLARQLGANIANVIRAVSRAEEIEAESGTRSHEFEVRYRGRNEDGTVTKVSGQLKAEKTDPKKQAEVANKVAGEFFDSVFKDFDQGIVHLFGQTINLRAILAVLENVFGSKEKDNKGKVDYELGKKDEDQTAFQDLLRTIFSKHPCEPEPTVDDSEAQSLSDVYNGALGNEALKPLAELLGGEANLVGILSNLTPDTLEALATLITKVQGAKKGEKPTGGIDETGASI